MAVTSFEQPTFTEASDFYYDEIDYPNDYLGNPAYWPANLGHPSWQRMTRWDDLGPNGHILRGEHPQWVWMHPATNWKQWWISGPREGKQGVILATNLDGVLDLNFEHRYSEGPYMIGADRERTDYGKGVINLGVVIRGENANLDARGPFALHKFEDSWRRSWSNTVPGFLGCFTRTHGWRWIPLIKGSPIKADLAKSPTRFGNNTMIHSMEVHAPWPLFAKRAVTRVWEATLDDVDEHGVATHTFAIPNAGTWEKTYLKFIVRGEGEVTIQDGIEGRMVPLPKLHPDVDGDYMLVDTDPAQQTIVTEKQPVDSALYRYMRNSEFLELLIPNRVEKTLPAQRRIPGGIEFDNPLPPLTVAHIKVTHTNPHGSVTAICPQYYTSAWS